MYPEPNKRSLPEGSSREQAGPSASGSAGRRRRSGESDDASAGRPSKPGGRRRGGGRRKKEPRRFGRLLTVLVGALVVALVALGAVLYFRSTGGDEAGVEAAQETRPATYRIVDTGRMNEVLASRDDDSRPLNEGELFERHNTEISSQKIDFTLRDADLTDDCGAAVWGEELRQALAAADCTQAGRATYVSETYFGVAAVFNLADAEASRSLAAAMAEPTGADEAEPGEGEDASGESGFVLPPSGEAPFDRLGSGFSAGDAIVSGHYLVVVWVQSDNSESVDDRVSLAGPLVSLANFRDPLYRRLTEIGGDESEAGTDGTDGTDGTGGTGGTGETGGAGVEGTEETVVE